MYGGGSVEKAAKRLGLPAELVEEAEGFGQNDEIYPDNVQTVEVFKRLHTQWRAGPSGAIGLVYESLDRVFKRLGVAEDDEADVFDCLQIMEMAALKAMRGEAEDDDQG